MTGEDEWMRRVESAERVNRFAKVTEEIWSAFNRQDSRNLKRILELPQDWNSASERALEEERVARRKPEHDATGNLIVAAASVLVGIVGIITNFL